MDSVGCYYLYSEVEKMPKIKIIGEENKDKLTLFILALMTLTFIVTTLKFVYDDVTAAHPYEVNVPVDVVVVLLKLLWLTAWLMTMRRVWTWYTKHKTKGTKHS